MAFTNITKISGVIGATIDGKETKYFVGEPKVYQFSDDGNTAIIAFDTPTGLQEYRIFYTRLKVNGQIATSPENAKILLNAIFGS